MHIFDRLRPYHFTLLRGLLALALSSVSTAPAQASLWGDCRDRLLGLHSRAVARRWDLSRAIQAGVPSRLEEIEGFSRVIKGVAAASSAEQASLLGTQLEEIRIVWADPAGVETFESELLKRAEATGRRGRAAVFAALEAWVAEMNGGTLGRTPLDRGFLLVENSAFFEVLQEGPFVDEASFNDDERAAIPEEPGRRIILRPHGTHSHLYQWAYLAWARGPDLVNDVWRTLAQGALAHPRAQGPYAELWSLIFDRPDRDYRGPLGPYWVQERLTELGRGN